MKRILGYNEALRVELEAFLQAKHAAADAVVPWKIDFLERLLPFATTGKLLRGSLVCFSYEAFAGQPVTESIMKTAMALELTHSALLIHDDIMDNDAIRRGRPSLHQQYRTLGIQKQLAPADRFGDSMAMCAGDATLFLAFELLASVEAPMPIKRTVQQLFTEQLVTTCAGQMQDLYLEVWPVMPSKKAIYNLMKTKTASYTIALPLTMGAALAGQPPDLRARLQAIGSNAGIIFQIRDDELGVMGNSEITGKPIGSDIMEGKKTLLYHYLLKQCSARERSKVKIIFGQPGAEPEDITYIRKLVKNHGVTKLLNDEIGRLEGQTLDYIKDLPVTEKTKKEFKELVRFCGKRQS
jgi:geranylgeranyl diphosphate synthase, type I